MAKKTHKFHKNVIISVRSFPFVDITIVDITIVDINILHWNF